MTESIRDSKTTESLIFCENYTPYNEEKEVLL
nr:MAG TPA: hypothetical protein [Caudoviricetes sp.]